YLESLALHREIGDRGSKTGWVLHHLGGLALEQGMLEEAGRYFTESLVYFQARDEPARNQIIAVAHTHANSASSRSNTSVTPRRQSCWRTAWPSCASCSGNGTGPG